MYLALFSMQQQDIDRVLAENPRVFSCTLGCTNVVIHRIPTLPREFYRVRWCPTPQKLWEMIGHKVTEMLLMGIIELSCSAWRSLVVLVPKPNGSIRFCMDCSLAKFDAYPIPKVDILIDQLGTARYLSALDFTKGYWQVPVHPPDCEKMAFTMPQGLYQFTLVPFGLHGVAATFQRLVDQALVGLHQGLH